MANIGENMATFYFIIWSHCLRRLQTSLLFKWVTVKVAKVWFDSSVTRFGKILGNLANFKKSLATLVFEKKIETSLAIFCFWANFHWCKWSIWNKWTSHLVTLFQSFIFWCQNFFIHGILTYDGSIEIYLWKVALDYTENTHLLRLTGLDSTNLVNHFLIQHKLNQVFQATFFTIYLQITTASFSLNWYFFIFEHRYVDTVLGTRTQDPWMVVADVSTVL